LIVIYKVPSVTSLFQVMLYVSLYQELNMQN